MLNPAYCLSVLTLLIGTLANVEAADSPPLQANFDLSRYAGVWHEVYRTSNVRFERGSDITATYTIKSDGSINVLNKAWLAEEERWHTATATAKVVDAAQPAQLSIKFKWWLPGGDYRVLMTDYDQVALVYSDTSYLFGLYRTKMAWILARKPDVADEVIEDAFEFFQQHTTLDRIDFIKTPQGQAPKN